MLAYERSVEGRTGRLFPSARFQIVRDLYFAEWQERSQRLGELLFPLYFPPPPPAGAAAAAAVDGGAAAAGAGASGQAAGGQPTPPSPSGSSSSSAGGGGAGLSNYERERAKQILANQAKLKELGLLDLLLKKPASKAAGKKRAPPKPEAAAAAPSRASGRLATAPKVSYKPQKAALPSDEEEEDEDESSEDESSEDEDEDEDEEYANGSEDDNDDDSDDGEAAVGGSSSGAGGRGGGKKKKKKKTTALLDKGNGKAAVGGAGAKGKAAAGGGGGAGAPTRKKQVVSRGARASVAPGGRGFKCPGGCDAFFDSAEEAITHGAQLCGVVGNGRGGRVYDATGKTCCLWDGCGKPFTVSLMKDGKWTFGASLHHLLKHEKEHVKGDAAAFTGFKCPEAGCTFSNPTSAAVWAHAAEAHGIEEDTRRCLGAGCDRRFVHPAHYRAHEGVHTGIFPFTCPACGKGHAAGAGAKFCCEVRAACRCGAVYKGLNAKRGFSIHQNKCKMGAAQLPATTAAANPD